MSTEVPSGRTVANMIADLQHDARVTRNSEEEVRRHFNAGRLAGQREAAEAVEDWRRQHAAAIEDNGDTRRHLVAVRDAMEIKAAILALAKP